MIELLLLSGVGYPTVEAALQALKARPDITLSGQGGWVIADDKANKALWSFTPPGHPAHPAVVRREVVQQDGQVAFRMGSLCQGSQPACDQLLAEFQRANEHLRQSLSPPPAPGSGPAAWQPTAAQKERVLAASTAYFADKDAGRYREAWARLGEGMRGNASFEQWRAAAVAGAARSGVVRSREVKKVTIYRSSHSGAPGTYAAVDFTGSFANGGAFDAYLVWSEQADGSFTLVREEDGATPNQRLQAR